MTFAVRDLIAIGKIVKVFGIKGEVIVRPMTDIPARFRRLRQVFLADAGAAERGSAEPAVETTIERADVAPRGIRVKLACSPDRTAAEELVGMLLLVAPADRVSLPAGTYFVDDLIGVTVRSEDGEEVGVLKEVLHMPAHDVYVIDDAGTDLLIPAVPEFVRKVDMAARTLTVKLIEGMRG